MALITLSVSKRPQVLRVGPTYWRLTQRGELLLGFNGQSRRNPVWLEETTRLHSAADRGALVHKDRSPIDALAVPDDVVFDRQHI
jgi:hypothetical protein